MGLPEDVAGLLESLVVLSHGFGVPLHDAEHVKEPLVVTYVAVQ
jgi:hypothetical protein